VSVKRPDYRLSRGGAGAICEVKEFTTRVITERLMAAPRQTATLSPKEQFGTVRDAISKAAAQLKPYRDRGEPLVIVLANPHNADVSLDPEDVMAAMYGNPGVRLTLDTITGTAVDENPSLLRDGALSTKHAYVSAVVALYRRRRADDHLDRWKEGYRAENEMPRSMSEEAARRFLDALSAERDSGRVPEGSYVYANVFETIASATGEAHPLQHGLLDDERSKRYGYDTATGTYGLVAS
jgi:hypothetical protein